MIKLGKIKSWYIDPEDNCFTYIQHNILFMKVIDSVRVYSVRHDTIESDAFDVAVETGSFELNGKIFNARFDDIYGRTNYTNVTI